MGEAGGGEGMAAHKNLTLRSGPLAASRRVASGLMVRDGARAPPHHEGCRLHTQTALKNTLARSQKPR